MELDTNFLTLSFCIQKLILDRFQSAPTSSSLQWPLILLPSVSLVFHIFFTE